MKKMKEKVWAIMIPFFIAMLGNKCWAIGSIMQSGSIGTAEVTRATDNVKNAIIKLAMPIGRCISICKCCYYINKDDCKCK